CAADSHAPQIAAGSLDLPLSVEDHANVTDVILQAIVAIEEKSAVHDATAQARRKLALASDGLEVLAGEFRRPTARSTRSDVRPVIDRPAAKQGPRYQIDQVGSDVGQPFPLLRYVEEPGRPT